MFNLFCLFNLSASLRVFVFFLATFSQVGVFDHQIAASDPAQQSDAESESPNETRTGPTVDTEWPPSEPERLLRQLKQRDAAFENRNLQVIEH